MTPESRQYDTRDCSSMWVTWLCRETATVNEVSGSLNSLHNSPLTHLGFVTCCLAQTDPVRGYDEVRKVTIPSPLRPVHLGVFPSPRLTQHAERGVAFTYQPAYSLPRGPASVPKDPPLWVATQIWGRSEGLHQPPAPPSSRIDSAPSRAALPRPRSSPALPTPPPSPPRSRCSCRRDR